MAAPATVSSPPARHRVIPAHLIGTTPSGHTGHVHCVAVDPSGRFMATCSSDRRVRVFTCSLQRPGGLRCMRGTDSPWGYAGGSTADQSSSSDDDLAEDSTNVVGVGRSPWQYQFALDEDLDGPVLKVVWACHERSLYLAAAAGRRANVYMLGWQRSGPATLAPPPSSFQDSPPHLVASMVAQLDGLGDTITDIAICPSSPSFDRHGLMLACASLDGCVRFYLPAEGKKLAPRYGKLCPAEDVMSDPWTAVDGNSVKTGWIGRRSVVQTSLRAPVAAAPSAPKPAARSAKNTKPSSSIAEAPPAVPIALPPPCGVTAIGWLPSTTDPFALLLTGTELGTVDCYLQSRCDHKSSYVPMVLSAPNVLGKNETFSQLRLPGSVTCIAWAPTVGRKFDLVVVGTRQGTAILRLHKVPLPPQQPSTTATAASGVTNHFRVLSTVAMHGEVFFAPDVPCVQASWDTSSTMISLIDDQEDEAAAENPSTAEKGGGGCHSTQGGVGIRLRVLHPSDWSNHQSWCTLTV